MTPPSARMLARGHDRVDDLPEAQSMRDTLAGWRNVRTAHVPSRLTWAGADGAWIVGAAAQPRR